MGTLRSDTSLYELLRTRKQFYYLDLIFWVNLPRKVLALQPLTRVFRIEAPVDDSHMFNFP